MATTDVSSSKNIKPMLSSSTINTESLFVPIDFALGRIQEGSPKKTASELISQHSGRYGSIALVVRRPGWALCREHGLQLTRLAANENENKALFDGFNLFGVIKETGVDDTGLEEFHDVYFPHPVYRDEDLFFYSLFGDDNSIFKGVSWNPFQLYKDYKDLGVRMKEKNIEGNLVGEGLKTGGIIIFDKKGEPKYAYPEQTGTPLVEEDLVSVLRAIVENDTSSSSSEL